MNLARLLLPHAIVREAAGVVLVVAPEAIPGAVGIHIERMRTWYRAHRSSGPWSASRAGWPSRKGSSMGHDVRRLAPKAVMGMDMHFRLTVTGDRASGEVEVGVLGKVPVHGTRTNGLAS